MVHLDSDIYDQHGRNDELNGEETASCAVVAMSRHFILNLLAQKCCLSGNSMKKTRARLLQHSGDMSVVIEDGKNVTEE